jgi:type II secretory pathway component PulF
MTEPEPRRPVVLPVVLALLPALLWAGCVALLIFLVPGCERTFADFRMKVSSATILVIEVSRWVVKYWYVLPVPGVVALLIQGAVTWLLLRSRAWRWLGVLWALLQTVAPLLAGGLVLWCMLTTYMDLVEGLRGQQP